MPLVDISTYICHPSAQQCLIMEKRNCLPGTREVKCKVRVYVVSHYLNDGIPNFTFPYLLIAPIMNATLIMPLKCHPDLE